MGSSQSTKPYRQSTSPSKNSPKTNRLRHPVSGLQQPFSRSRMSKLDGHFRPTWVTSIPDDFKKSLQGNVICAVGSSVVDKGSLKRLQVISLTLRCPGIWVMCGKQLISPHKGEVWCQHCGQCWSHCEAFGWGRMCRTALFLHKTRISWD